MILVTGAAGKTGRAVIRALSARNVPVRALIRDQAQADRVGAAGAAETVAGDMGDLALLSRATQDTQAVYHICPNMHPDEVAIGRRIIAAARDARLEHFVYHSVLHPQVEAMPHHWRKMRVEELLFTSGLEVTILQPAAYMQNLLAGWQTIAEQGLYRVPYSIHARLSLVDLLNVAETAAIVVTEPGHRGATYELAGNENLSQVDVAAVLSGVLARRVTAEQIPIDTWRWQADAGGLGQYQVESLVKMFAYYDQHGLVGNSRVLEHLLGRPATDLATFVRRIAGPASFDSRETSREEA